MGMIVALRMKVNSLQWKLHDTLIQTIAISSFKHHFKVCLEPALKLVPSTHSISPDQMHDLTRCNKT